ncbi:polymer-forming cytoskeletal protein [bacterium]|nr:polymer-forming cytoskeletal protein [FCB group bacterium]MBL7191747.1 polymer-forming cytoskeletal protein [bacterium]
MAKNRNSAGEGELATIIGHNSHFEGKMIVKHGVRIDGVLKGELDSTDTVTIGANGVVEGNIKAKNVIIGGRITGSIEASGKVILESNSKLKGDLKTVKLVIEEGAVFNGSAEMNDGGTSVKIQLPPLEKDKKSSK